MNTLDQMVARVMRMRNSDGGQFTQHRRLAPRSGAGHARFYDRFDYQPTVENMTMNFQEEARELIEAAVRTTSITLPKKPPTCSSRRLASVSPAASMWIG